MQYLSSVISDHNWQIQSVNEIKRQYLRQVQHFNIPQVRAWVAVMYFMAQSWLHTVINCLRLPEPNQNMLYVSWCGQYSIPQQHCTKTYKFTGDRQILHIGSKLHVRRKPRSLATNALQIYWWACQWKSCENQSIFDAVMTKTWSLTFTGPLCIYLTYHSQWSRNIWNQRQSNPQIHTTQI